jgi:hypothetical protein
MKLEADGDFTCIPKGAVLEIYTEDDGDLCVRCDVGCHALEGQLSDEDHDSLIGLYPVPEGGENAEVL